MLKGKIEIRDFNWKPLVFTATLLASKFWEDIIWYNVDFVENLEMYSLRSINRMESEFLSLCDYNIYVSAEKYEQYQDQVRAISFPDLYSSYEHYNRRPTKKGEGLQDAAFAHSNNTTTTGGLLQRLKRVTSFGSAQEAIAQHQYMNANTSLDSGTVPLLTLDKRENNNPIFRIGTSITNTANPEFTITQAVFDREKSTADAR